MSNAAITWALKQRIDRSSAKFLLFVLANCADTNGLCWPSQAYLSEATAQNRKTVIEGLKRLCAQELIVDSGFRKGKSAQIIVYKLLMEVSPEIGTVEPSPKRDCPELGTVPNILANSPDFSSEQFRFSHETSPLLGHGYQSNLSNTSGNQSELWCKDEKSIIEKGQEVGLERRQNERLHFYKNRIHVALAKKALKEAGVNA